MAHAVAALAAETGTVSVVGEELRVREQELIHYVLDYWGYVLQMGAPEYCAE